MCIRDSHIPLRLAKVAMERIGIVAISYEPVSYTHLDVYKRQELPNQSSSSTMSKTNKNKDVDPEYAELKRENARLKAAIFQAESKALVNKTLLEVVLNRYHIDLKKKTDLQP